MDGDPFGKQGMTLVSFFFLATFAAAIPAIISGGIAERAKFWPQCAATLVLVALVYPIFEGIVWNGNYGIQEWFGLTKVKHINGCYFNVVGLPCSELYKRLKNDYGV